MRFLLLTLLTLCIMATTQAQFSGKRQVLLFGASQSPAVKEQLQLLDKEAKGVRERDMEVVLAAEKENLYRKYEVARDAAFVLVLVGKDGGEKYRSQKPVAAAELFGVIDAMPMRQSEMRRRKGE